MTKRANVAMGTAQAAERIGFIALRVTPTLFDQALAKRSGLGGTGQVMAAGADGRLRSNPPLNATVKAGNDLDARWGSTAAATRGAGASTTPPRTARRWWRRPGLGARRALDHGRRAGARPRRWRRWARLYPRLAADRLSPSSPVTAVLGLCSPARSCVPSAPSPAPSRPSPGARRWPRCRAATAPTRSAISPGPSSSSGTSP